MILCDLEKMVYKSVLAVIMLLCLTAAIEARGCKSVGSNSLRSSGWSGRKQDYTYRIPYRATYVYLQRGSGSTPGISIGGGDGRATLSWRPGRLTAKVHAWVNGKIFGRNKVSWTVMACT